MSAGRDRTFSSEDAGYVCALLRHGKTDPELWTRQERRAVTRLHALRDQLTGADPQCRACGCLLVTDRCPWCDDAAGASADGDSE